MLHPADDEGLSDERKHEPDFLQLAKGHAKDMGNLVAHTWRALRVRTRQRAHRARRARARQRACRALRGRTVPCVTAWVSLFNRGDTGVPLRDERAVWASRGMAHHPPHASPSFFSVDLTCAHPFNFRHPPLPTKNLVEHTTLEQARALFRVLCVQMTETAHLRRHAQRRFGSGRSALSCRLFQS